MTNNGKENEQLKWLSTAVLSTVLVTKGGLDSEYKDLHAVCEGSHLSLKPHPEGGTLAAAHLLCVSHKVLNDAGQCQKLTSSHLVQTMFSRSSEQRYCTHPIHCSSENWST